MSDQVFSINSLIKNISQHFLKTTYQIFGDFEKALFLQILLINISQ